MYVKNGELHFNQSLFRFTGHKKTDNQYQMAFYMMAKTRLKYLNQKIYKYGYQKKITYFNN